jgi:pimeloyl-ACP methyl ester carboxylesterase
MPSRVPLTAKLLAAGALAAGAAELRAQRRLRRAIAADPLSARLEHPPRGRPLRAVSADGTALHVELFGPQEGQTIVLAHGWTEQLRYWTLVIERLVAAGLRVAAYDLRGHGDSQPAAGGDYSTTRFGEDVEAVLEALGAGPEDARMPVLAGHSLGAMSIVAWAERHAVAERVAAVALLNTGVGDLLTESLLVPVPWLAGAINRTPAGRIMLGSRGRLPRISTPLRHAAIRYVAFGPEATPAQVAFYERMLIACPPDVRADVGLALSELRLYDAVPRIDVPAVVIAGERDRLTPPSHAERIAAALPQLRRLIVLPETGHMGPLERPREIAEALLELARSVRAGVGAAEPAR